jgi:hypothetical protein
LTQLLLQQMQQQAQQKGLHMAWLQECIKLHMLQSMLRLKWQQLQRGRQSALHVPSMIQPQEQHTRCSIQ